MILCRWQWRSDNHQLFPHHLGDEPADSATDVSVPANLRDKHWALPTSAKLQARVLIIRAMEVANVLQQRVLAPGRQLSNVLRVPLFVTFCLQGGFGSVEELAFFESRASAQTRSYGLSLVSVCNDRLLCAWLRKVVVSSLVV